MAGLVQALVAGVHQAGVPEEEAASIPPSQGRRLHVHHPGQPAGNTLIWTIPAITAAFLIMETSDRHLTSIWS